MATLVEVDEHGTEHPIRVTGELLADTVIEVISNGITMINEINGEIIQGNLSDKLNKILDTKDRIASAIRGIGVSVPDNAPFAQYPQFIVEILAVVAGQILVDLNFFADQLLNILGDEEVQEEQNE
jgi:hypothetical protein